MIYDDLTRMSCKSKAYYQEVTSVEVKPVEEYHPPYKLLYRKGDTIVKKRLFRDPIYSTAETDIYDYWGERLTPQELTRRIGGIHYDEEKNSFYIRALVKVVRNGFDSHFYFDTNEEAKRFVMDLKEKCKACGNELL